MRYLFVVANLHILPFLSCLPQNAGKSKQMNMLSNFFNCALGVGPYLLIFSAPAPLKKLKEEPLSASIKYIGVEKFVTFNQNCYSRQRYKIGPWLLWITNRKSEVTDQSTSILMTWSDLESQDAIVRGSFSQADLHMYVLNI